MGVLAEVQHAGWLLVLSAHAMLYRHAEKVPSLASGGSCVQAPMQTGGLTKEKSDVLEKRPLS